VGTSEPSVFEGEAAPSTITFSLPTAGSDSTTAFTTSTIFSGTGGLDSITDDQGIIASANTTTSIFVGINGYLLGSATTGAGTFRFKTSSNVTSISATYTKFNTELATVYIRSGWVAGTGDVLESSVFGENDSTVTINYTNLRSYYFELGTLFISGTTTASNNQAYLTSLSFTIDNDLNPLSLLASHNFIDGGNSSNNSYTGTNLSTSVANELDNPGGSSGTTDWIADWANLSLSTGTRIGTAGTAAQSSVQTNDTTAWANVRTNFKYNKTIQLVKIINLVNNSGSATLENLYLQYTTIESPSTVIWTTVSTKTIADVSNGILYFADLNIPSNSYLRFGMSTVGSASSTQIHFTGIQVFSYADC
jgi:hypothetical protein